jgi:hypothetical protein
MAGLADIVKINISTQAAQVKQAGFGVACIVDAHEKFPERIRFYGEPAAMLDDGFAVTDAAYQAAVKLCSQNPRVAQFAVGRRANKPTLQVTLTPTVRNAEKYRVLVNGTEVSFTSDANALASEIVAGLKGAIDALGIATLVTATTATAVTITGNAAGAWFSVGVVDPAQIAAEQTHADPGIANDLAAIALENGDFYGLILTTASKAEVLAAAAWVEANGKLYVQASQDTAIVTAAAAGATDVAAQAKTSAYARTSVFYHPRPDAFADAALFGKCFPKDPGSLTFKFKTLAGVPAVALTGTQITNAKNKNAMYYTSFGGVPITAEGKVAAGEWIDVIRDRDHFESRLQTRIFSVLANADKVPFTDRGINLVATEVRGQISDSIASGFLADDPTPEIVVPKARNVAAIDKAARNLTGIEFTATIAGAVHALTINGKITV